MLMTILYRRSILQHSLSPHGALESRGKVWGQAGDGTTQADLEAGAYFVVGWHPQLDSVVAATGGAAGDECDDLVVCVK